jgi:multimeric flavodoxin WrbA
MNILVLNGSPRMPGTVASLLRAATEGVDEKRQVD